MSKKIEKICGIYCIESLIDGKKYIGKAVDINRRVKRHIQNLKNNYHYNKHLQRVWNKYGENNLRFYIIEICEIEKLADREIFYIEAFDSMNNGFNNTYGGDGASGTRHTEEAKRKIGIASSIRNKGKTWKLGKDTIKNMIYGSIGRKSKNAFSKYSGVRKRKYFSKKENEYKYFYESHFHYAGIGDKNIGNFKKEIDAAKRWDEKSWETYHDLNKLNFPEDYKNK